MARGIALNADPGFSWDALHRYPTSGSVMQGDAALIVERRID